LMGRGRNEKKGEIEERNSIKVIKRSNKGRDIEAAYETMKSKYL